MTLFGSLSSGVSGLSAQSSAMGAISDNITNVSTIGYKNTFVNFSTLVTKQTSTTFYSAGGVQSKPRQDTGVQGLLQASTSQTDIAISGQGYFVVNEANVPTISNQFLFTRAGSFFQDNEGYLRNTSGFYLQAWPTTAAGSVTPNNKSLTIPNQNVISTDYLGTVNLNRVGGTAAATTSVAIGANLPTTDTQGVTHKTDVQFFDSLGNANTMSYVYTKSSRDNQWDVSANPPQGTQVLTLEDSSGNAFKSVGQLEFIERPNNGSSVVIEGVTYQFNSAAVTETATLKHVDTSGTTSVAQDVSALLAEIIASDSDFDTINNRVKLNPGNSASLLFQEDGSGYQDTTPTTQAGIIIDPTGLLTSTGTFATRQEASFTVRKTAVNYRDYEQFTFANGAHPDDADKLIVGTTTYTFLDAEVAAADSDKDIARLTSTTLTATALTFATADNSVTAGTGTPFANFQPGDTIDFNTSANAATLTVVSVSTTGDKLFFAAVAAEVTATGQLAVGRVMHNILTDLEAAIEANDANFAAGADTVRIRAAGRNTGTATDSSANTLILSNLATAYTTTFATGYGGTVPTNPDGTAKVTVGTAFTIDKSNAIIFNSDGIPSTFNVAETEILGFENGSFDMDDDPNRAKQMTLDFGTVGEANGMTQFGAEFTPVFITTDGSQFGTFAGVTISNSGTVTALFDNGETRPVYQLPIATFTNVNALDGRTGNVWNATEASGDPTLRVADNGPAGQVVQSTLEQSTVDIGEEFTKMIVVQRAFSAAAKIISTADAMLEELLRTKR